MRKAADVVIEWMQDITRVLWSAAALLSPWLVPIAPASFFGWSLYLTAIKTAMPVELSIAVGVVAAVGLETVNIAAAHAALHLSHNYRDHSGKFALSVLLIVFYVAVGLVGVSYLDVDLSTRVIGGALFLLAPIAITAQALTLDLSRVLKETEQRYLVDTESVQREKEAELERRNRDQEAEIERRRLEMEQAHSLRVERLHVNAQVRMAKVEAATALTGQVDNERSGDRTWPDKDAFVSDPDRPRGVTSSQLSKMTGISDRTARRWLAAARSRNGHSDNAL